MYEASGANGPTGPAGPAGDPGPAGPPGPSGTFTNAATFRSTDTKTYSGGSKYSGVVLPLQQQTLTTNPSAYTLNNDGTVTINQKGSYRVSAQVEQSGSDSNAFAVQVNGGGANPGMYNSFSTDGGGDKRGFITTVMPLNPGDRISVSLISPGPSTLKQNPAGTSTSTSTVGLSIVQVA